LNAALFIQYFAEAPYVSKYQNRSNSNAGRRMHCDKNRLKSLKREICRDRDTAVEGDDPTSKVRGTRARAVARRSYPVRLIALTQSVALSLPAGPSSDILDICSSCFSSARSACKRFINGCIDYLSRTRLKLCRRRRRRRPRSFASAVLNVRPHVAKFCDDADA